MRNKSPFLQTSPLLVVRNKSPLLHERRGTRCHRPFPPFSMLARTLGQKHLCRGPGSACHPNIEQGGRGGRGLFFRTNRYRTTGRVVLDRSQRCTCHTRASSHPRAPQHRHGRSPFQPRAQEPRSKLVICWCTRRGSANTPGARHGEKGTETASKYDEFVQKQMLAGEWMLPRLHARKFNTRSQSREHPNPKRVPNQKTRRPHHTMQPKRWQYERRPGYEITKLIKLIKLKHKTHHFNTTKSQNS